MRRRDFIAGISGSVAWPHAARTQQPSMPVIGFLRDTSRAGSLNLVTAFRAGLNEAGFVEGQNVAIEYRWAENQHDRLPALVAELIHRPVAVFFGNTPPALAAKAATSTVPIVFATGSDPVRDGLVASLNRPGDNITGVVFFFALLGTKRLELLRRIAPKMTTIAMLVNPNSLNTEAERTDVRTAALAIGQDLIVLDVTHVRDIETAITTCIQRGAGALLVGSGSFLNSHRERVVALAARHRLPAIYAQREAAMAGGLMSYGPSIANAYRQAGVYVGRILKGERPSDLPVIRSTKFEFVLNLRTAKMLNLDVPADLSAIADEVIE